MTDLFQTAQAIASSGVVEADDILSLRRAIFADGIVSRAEASALFEIERTRKAHSDAWSELFVEALTDYALNQEEPQGYLSDDTAAFIAAEISKRREPSTDADLELAVNLIEKAREVPASFAAFALRLAKDGAIHGDGPDGRGRIHKSGAVDAADVAMLQRILWGAGGEGQLAISREEAEALFAIADATAGAENVPEFDDLFARAIGNYLIGATGRAVPSRQDALELRAAGDYKIDVLRALSRMLHPTMADLEEGLHMRTLTEEVSLASEAEHKSRNDARELEAAANAIMTPDKSSWLLDHVNKNGVMTGPEKALLRFVQREAASLAPALKATLAKVA